MDQPDKTAHGELIEQQAFLRRLARHLVADEHAAEDLVQETSVAALERAPSGLASMRAWLTSVLRNRAKNASRGERRRAARELDAARHELPETPDEVAQHLAVQRRVLAAVEALSEPYKTTIYLRYYADLGPTAIAGRMGVPLPTVKTRLARGLERLRAELDAEHGGDRRTWAMCLAGTFGVGREMAIGTSVAAGGAVMGATMLGTKWIAAALTVSLAWWIGSSVMERAAEPVVGEHAGVEPKALVTVHEKEAPLEHPESASERSALPAPAIVPEPEASGSAWRLRLLLGGLTVGIGEATSIEVDHDLDVSTPNKTFTAPAAGNMEIDVSSIFAGNPRPPNRLLVRLDHPRYLPVDAGVNVPLPTNAPSDMEVNIDLVKPSGIVTGSAFPPAGVEPSKIHVDVFALEATGAPAGSSTDTTHVAPDGGYRLRVGAAAAHILVAWVEKEPTQRDARHRPDMFRPENRSVILVDGKCELAPIAFDRGAPIMGRIEFPEGGAFEGKVEVMIAPYGELHVMNGLSWFNDRFVLGEVEAQWDENRHFVIEGLTEADYGVRVVGAPPPPVPSIRALRFDWSVEPRVRVSAPEPDLVLSIVRLRHAFLVTGAGVPLEGARFEAEFRGLYGLSDTQSLNTNADGRIDVLLDKGLPLMIEASHPGYRSRKLELSAAELETSGMIEVELEEDGPPATIEITPDESGWPEGVACQLVLFDLDALGQTSSAIAKQQIPCSVSVPTSSGYGGLLRMPRSTNLEVKIATDGEWRIDDIPPGSYFLRIVARSTHFDVPCFYLPIDFDLQLAPDAYSTLEWQPQLGGVLRLDFRGSGEGVSASLVDALGEKCALTYFRQGVGLMDMTVGPGPLIPGPSLAHPAIAAGTYTLRIQAPDGNHVVPVTIEAGRVTELQVDLDDL